MPSQYDSYWQTHLDSVLALVEQARTNGKSDSLPLTGLDGFGDRATWHGKVEIVGGRPVYDSGAHSKALGEAVARRLPQGAPDEAWILSVSKDLQLTVQRVTPKQTNWFEMPYRAAKRAETVQRASALLGPLTPEWKGGAIFRTGSGGAVYVLWSTRVDGWLSPLANNLSALAEQSGEVAISLTKELTGEFYLWMVPATEVLGAIERSGYTPSLNKGNGYNLYLEVSETGDLVRPLDWDIRPYRKEAGHTDLTRATFWPPDQPALQRRLAQPFSEMFADWEEADWAFDLLAEVMGRLSVRGPEDPMTAFTLTRTRGLYRMRFTYGSWPVFAVCGIRGGLVEVELALFHQEDVAPGRFVYHLKPRRGWMNDAMITDEDSRKTGTHVIPIEQARPLQGALRVLYFQTLDYIKELFSPWKRSNYHVNSHAEIGKAALDRGARLALLATDQGPDETEVDPPDEDDGDGGAVVVAGYQIQPEYTLEKCAEETGFAVAQLREWVRAIERKGQAILYGPPGTGKTFVAERLAQHLIGGQDGFFELVQFHPAYAYEDFIQGIRPTTVNGDKLAYPTVPGRFLEFCRAASGRGPCVLIIDEINRANLARVFGELMYLLEYRDREVPLAGGGALHIPRNVRLIGTMNTADRSIALVDHALRRRFAFLALYPNYDVLRAFHLKRETGYPVEGLIDQLKSLNNTIHDRHYQVGISFFMRERLSDEIADIWRMEIEPYLDEYFFDQPDKADAFRWDKVRARIGA